MSEQQHEQAGTDSQGTSLEELNDSGLGATTGADSTFEPEEDEQA